MVLNFLSFCLPVKLLITPSYLNEILAEFSNLDCRFFFFITLSISCHSLLAWRVSIERLAVILMGIPLCVICCFYLAVLIFALCVWSLLVWLICVLGCFALGLSCLGLFPTSVVSYAVWPHRRQPTRLPHLWDSPGKNTGVVCHFLLQCMKVKSESEVSQSCLTLSDPMDCSLPGSSLHGIFQAREY